MGCEVEIEFAVDLEAEMEKSGFYFLQIRPMVTGGERVDVRSRSGNRTGLLLFPPVARAWPVQEHGRYPVCPQGQLRSGRNRDIAAEIGALNRRLQQQKRPFLLIGPGRWGSADPWLGIPVQWSDISGVGAIIEIRSEQLRADPPRVRIFFRILPRWASRI